MIAGIYIAVLAALLGMLYFGMRSYVKLRGKRLVTCPGSGEVVSVEADAIRAVFTGAFGKRRLRLQDCSRWPERRDCGQECLKEIEASPADCLVRTIVGNWYRGKACSLCAKPFGDSDWYAHKPCFMDRERNTFEWATIRPETIPDVLAASKPICWTCHTVETFRRKFPELVVNRDL